MLYSIQYLRGLAALLVILFHARSEINGVYPRDNLGDLLFENGMIGVDLFFMVSGFVMMLSTRKVHSARSFVLKRWFRLYPVYIVCLMLSLLIFKDRSFDADYLKALFFINRDLSAEAPFFGYAVIFTAWTLMFEVVFYMLFLLSMTISHRWRGWICCGLIAALIGFLQLYFNHSLSLQADAAVTIPPGHPLSIFSGLIRLLSSPMFLEFAIGIVIFNLYEGAKTRRREWLSLGRVLLMGAAFTTLFLLGSHLHHGPLATGLFTGLLLLACVLHDKFYPVQHWPIMDWLGNLSYSVYLVHPMIIYMLQEHLRHTVLYNPDNGFVNIVLILILSYAASALLYYSIELPGMRLGRRLLKRLEPAAGGIR